MRVDAYFQSIHAAVDACLWVRARTLHFDQRATHQGMLRGEIYFIDGPVLHVREFVDTERTIDRLAYSYQYMDGDQKLIFRYDNTGHHRPGHHRRLDLPTYPHHKHAGNEETVVPSSAPTLAQVLDEIAGQIYLPPDRLGSA